MTYYYYLYGSQKKGLLDATIFEFDVRYNLKNPTEIAVETKINQKLFSQNNCASELKTTSRMLIVACKE